MKTHIAKTAVQFDNYRTPSFFYKSAREGMQDCLDQILTSPSAGVLLPAFIGWSPREGSGVFDPIRALGVRPGFYTLNPDLTVDMYSLEKALEGNSFEVLVVIHYYGRTEPQISAIHALAKKHGTLLIEDLAHGFYSAAVGGVAGRYGAVNMFSLHKMFPAQDGGMITYRNADLIKDQRETASELAHLVLEYDWLGIAQARRSNFVEITNRLLELPECGSTFDLLWPNLETYDVPQTLPVRINTGNRDAIYQFMNGEGYGMVSLYHTLIDDVHENFPEMVALSKSIINFPVHQDVKMSSLDGLVQSFKTVLRLEPA